MTVRRLFPLLFALAAVACSRTPPSPHEPSAAAAPVHPLEMPAAAPAMTPKPFGEPCVADAECAGGVCFHKRIKTADSARERADAGDEAVEHDGYCSMRCREDADCPVPPTRGKCGARGMCKRAER